MICTQFVYKGYTNTQSRMLCVYLMYTSNIQTENFTHSGVHFVYTTKLCKYTKSIQWPHRRASYRSNIWQLKRIQFDVYILYVFTYLYRNLTSNEALTVTLTQILYWSELEVETDKLCYFRRAFAFLFTCTFLCDLHKGHFYTK